MFVTLMVGAAILTQAPAPNFSILAPSRVQIKDVRAKALDPGNVKRGRTAEIEAKLVVKNTGTEDLPIGFGQFHVTLLDTDGVELEPRLYDAEKPDPRSNGVLKVIKQGESFTENIKVNCNTVPLAPGNYTLVVNARGKLAAMPFNIKAPE